VRATPLARRIAHELGVDLGQIVGHSRSAAFPKADVLSYQKPQPVVTPRSAGAAPSRATVLRTVQTPVPVCFDTIARRSPKQVMPVTGARKIISNGWPTRFHRSAHQLSLRVDMTEAIRLREAFEPLKIQTAACLIRPFWCGLSPCCRVTLI
jgi:pyruvate/2-oxoglutarate dehydrogenase complex dihydrolipoamide acyltransferase (E2) component